jgi:hypothetical protein
MHVGLSSTGNRPQAGFAKGEAGKAESVVEGKFDGADHR